MNPVKLSLLLVTCMVPLISEAQTPSSTNKDIPKLPPSFVVADQNKDGYITKDEAKKVGISTVNFDAADKNKDNKLNLSEWTLLKF
jgi:Ca2+-binding EF-hand superfamily protein